MIATDATPLVSVLIPTHNRAESALNCLTSAINLRYSDCEIILSDNSSRQTDKSLTDSFVTKFENDPRFRFIRPKRSLNMADHWEWATIQTRGQYVAILTDRHVVRPSMFKVMGPLLERDQPDLLVWNVRSGYSGMSGIERTSTFTGVQEVIEPIEVLTEYLTFSAWNAESMFMQKLPRGLNSLYRNELASVVRKKHGRLFFPLSPDYTSAFLLLANAQTMSYVDLPFYTSFGTESNGQKSSVEGIQQYAATYPDVDPFEGCPIKMDSVFNTILRDYLAMQKRESNLQKYDFDLRGYFLSLYREILTKELFGSPQDTVELRRIWRNAVEQLAPDLKSDILDSLPDLDDRQVKFVRLRKFLYRTDLLPFVKSQIERVRGLKSRIGGETSYASVLEAVEATDHYLKRAKFPTID